MRKDQCFGGTVEGTLRFGDRFSRRIDEFDEGQAIALLDWNCRCVHEQRAVAHGLHGEVQEEALIVGHAFDL